jgi:hypothetical protein
MLLPIFSLLMLWIRADVLVLAAEPNFPEIDDSQSEPVDAKVDISQARNFCVVTQSLAEYRTKSTPPTIKQTKICNDQSLIF